MIRQADNTVLGPQAKPYWVHTMGPEPQYQEYRYRVVAYDADDAARQVRLAHPGEVVMDVGPWRADSPGREWVTRSDVAAMLGVSGTTAGKILAELQANGLRTLGRGRRARHRVADVRAGLEALAKAE